MNLPLKPKEINKLSSDCLSQDSKISVLTLQTNGYKVPLDISQPLDFKGQVGNIPTNICLDTGGGANVVNTSLTKTNDFTIIDTHTFNQPIELKVGDSGEMTITTAILAELKAEGNTELAWWLVHNKLPIPALIGRPTAERLKLTHDTNSGQVLWKGKLIPNTDKQKGLFLTLPQEKNEQDILPQDAQTTTTIC